MAYSNRRTLKSLQQAQRQREDEANKRLNISVAGAEKLGLKTVFDDWEILDAEQIDSRTEDADKERRKIYKVMDAPTTNPSRPRAKKLGYSRAAEKLIVKFRDDTDWEYNDIPLVIWESLKMSNSTGKFLKHNGLDTHYDMGPFDTDQLGPSAKVQWLM